MKAGPIEFRHHGKLTSYPQSATVTQVTAITTDTCVLTHPIVKIDATAGNVALAIPNGEEGQLLKVYGATADDITVTPATADGFTSILLTNIGDYVWLLYVDDTTGWTVLSAGAKLAANIPVTT